MEFNLKLNDKVFIIFHIAYTIITALMLLIPSSYIKIGVKLFILVIIYNISTFLIGVLTKDEIWLRIWAFSFLISIFQIFPDWFLSAELNILVFPEDGFPKIGTVSGYMFGLWTIPLFIIIFIGIKSRERLTELKAILIVLLLSLLIFGMSEATIWMIGSWYPQNVTILFNHIAIYIIPAELILGYSSYFVFTRIKDINKYYYYFPISFSIMLLYLGSSVFFYFLIERIMS
ncbi:MAG: hypothetical protein EU547_05520 [Promethearchaeota archaeon]|nr:MAG: hypothetical protein EU547_05520 [Candidatus Lokiarchaeota archaeon]